MQKTQSESAPNKSKGGEVIALPSFKTIPDPTLPLGKEGMDTYQQWCRDLLQFGLLTVRSREDVESFALSVDLLKKSIETGKNVRAAAELRRAARAKLDKFDADTTLAGPQGQGVNPFAKMGFAKRARAAHHDKN